MKKFKMSLKSVLPMAACSVFFACSVYDNYDIDLMQDAAVIEESSSSKNVENSSSSSKKNNKSSSSEASSSSEIPGQAGNDDKTSSSSSVKESSSSATDASSSSTPSSSSSSTPIEDPCSSSSVNEESSSSWIASSSSRYDTESSSSSEKVSSSSTIVSSSSSTQTRSSSSTPSSSSSSNPSEDPGSSSSLESFVCGTDKVTRGSFSYKTVKIRETCWTAENMKNAPATVDSHGCYGDDDSNCETYGRLYSYEAASTICPKGWRLPTVKDLQDISDYLDEWSDLAGTILKSKDGWDSGDAEPGTDEIGFTALPGGFYSTKYTQIGNLGYWWTSSEKTRDTHYVLKLTVDDEGFYPNGNALLNTYYASVRCVKE